MDVTSPKKKRRYKQYLEADNPDMDVPRATCFRIEASAIAVGSSEPKNESLASISTGPNDCPRPGCSNETDAELDDTDSDESMRANQDCYPTDHSESHVEDESENSLHGNYEQPHRENALILKSMEGNLDSSSNDSSDGSSSDDDHHHPYNNQEELDLNSTDVRDCGSDGEPPTSDPPMLPLPVDFEELRDKLEGQYAKRISDPVVVSQREILLNIQEFCKQHPILLTAQEDLHRLINCMFYKEIVPDTTYKLDKLYSSTTKIHKYFYCSHCFLNFGELDNKALRSKECPSCKMENIIHDLTKASFFIILEFVKQLQLLVEIPGVGSCLGNPNEFPDNGEVMKDLYDGEVYKNFVASLDFANGKYYVSLTACTDGTPVFKSSTLSIWPIFVSVNEFPPHVRMSNVLLAGLWFGRTHPKMDLFLEPFANYIRALSVEGFSLNFAGEQRIYRAYLLGVCVDSGARGAVQCVHTHTGESSCNWCLHPGEVEGGGSNARKFIQYEIEPATRTADEIIRDGRAVLAMPGRNVHVNGVTGISPLLRCPMFNICDGMVLDTLHWASFGVARRMGKLWLGETKPKKNQRNQVRAANEDNALLPEFYVGSDETKSVINQRLSKLRPPLEVRRLPRDLSQLHEFNAREWENFALFFSVPMFKNILPERFLRHWMLFLQAFYLLMKSNLMKREIHAAKVLMKMYVDGVQNLYGRSEMNFNIHISNHAADNASRWGNGWSVSTYAFEIANKILKSKIHAERGIPHQLIRSLDRDLSLSILRAVASTSQTDDFRKRLARKEVIKSFYSGSVRCMMPRTFYASREELWLCKQEGIDPGSFVRCSRIISDNICYSVDKGGKTDNSYAHCKDGNIVKIRSIIANEMLGKLYLFVSKVRCRPLHISGLPRNVPINFSPFMFTVDLIEQGLMIISSESLDTICVFMKVDCRFLKENFLSIMPNIVNVF